MKNRIFSILLAFTLVLVGTLGTTAMGVSAVDSNKYNEETLQEVYEEFTASSNPQKYFDALSKEVQTALIKTYAPEAWKAINNIRVETIVTTTEAKGGPQTITVTSTGYNGSLTAWTFSHWITWSWNSGSITSLSSGMSGTGYQTGAVKWVYTGGSYTEEWSYTMSYSRSSTGHFDFYMWVVTWIRFSPSDVDTTLDSIVYGDGTSA